MYTVTQYWLSAPTLYVSLHWYLNSPPFLVSYLEMTRAEMYFISMLAIENQYIMSNTIWLKALYWLEKAKVLICLKHSEGSNLANIIGRETNRYCRIISAPIRMYCRPVMNNKRWKEIKHITIRLRLRWHHRFLQNFLRTASQNTPNRSRSYSLASSLEPFISRIVYSNPVTITHTMTHGQLAHFGYYWCYPSLWELFTSMDTPQQYPEDGSNAQTHNRRNCSINHGLARHAVYVVITQIHIIPKRLFTLDCSYI